VTTLSSQQQEAHRQFLDWFNDPNRTRDHFYLGGYAGTGKTTLARHILETLPEEVRLNTVVMAPTGKAADVLRRKGLHSATTIHSAIYNPVSNYAFKIQTLRRRLEENLYESQEERIDIESELGRLVTAGPSFETSDQEFTRGKKLFMVDEFSMVGNRLYEDLVARGVPILALGDPGQLPPVKDEKPPFKPDYVMTEIHRQAEGNPVIKLAHWARTDGYVEIGEYGESRVVGPDDYRSEMLLEHDQIICFTNNTRKLINRRYRQLKGYTNKYPMEGEKLVCKANDRDYKLWNGAMYTATRDAAEFPAGITLGIKGHDVELKDLPTYNVPFLEYTQKIPEHTKLSRDELRGVQQFDYGYCITGHSSQGSEWDSVMIIDESGMIRGADERKQWLYTAITRAAKRVTIYKR